MSSPSFKVVLIEPEIPSNTGNIGRTCVAANSELNLVGPLGFELTDKKLKRAGLDYWPYLKYRYYKNIEEWRGEESLKRAWLFSVRGQTSLYDCKIQPGDSLIFGKETKGLKKDLLNGYPRQTVVIPFSGKARSLNLSNAVAIALFEALRQNRGGQNKQ